MRARFLFSTLSLLCGSLLLACGGPLTRPDGGSAMASAANDDYLRGRNLHLARRYDEAIAAYQAVLRADATHVNARNGLAIAYAEQRDFARAIPIWRDLTSGANMASGPEVAFVFANLGYADLLGGDLEGAQIALEKACLLDPLNARAWQYLGETLQQLGQEERAQQMLRQAEALRGHDFRSDYAAAGGGARLPAIEQAVKADERDDREWAFVEVIRKGDGMLELRRVPALGPTRRGKPAKAPAVPPAAPAAVAMLEISNGNGRQGLARQISRQIDDPGLRVVRLTNEKGFGVRQTRIEYRPAFRAAAERLAQRVGAGQPVESGPAGRVDVRLVIGRDLSLRGNDSRPAGVTLAQAGRSDGH